MRIVSWNIQKQSGTALDGVLAGLRSIQPDLLLLQAVTRASLATLSPARTLGLQHTAGLIDEAERAGKYAASVVVSRWPLTKVQPGWAQAPVRTDSALEGYTRLFPGWEGAAPRPWLLARASVHAPSGTIDVVDLQMPEGSEKAWDKLKSLVAVAAALAKAPPGARLVGGDLGVPRLETGERVVYFGAGSKRGPLWEKAGQMLLAGLPSLRDVYRAHHGYEGEGTRDAYSQIVGTAQRRYDHLFASSELTTDSVEYRTDWIRANISDHAPLVAGLSWANGAEA
jgi:endonuclease/exonuclease/phosphatase family metal-dependent hydrolase